MPVSLDTVSNDRPESAALISFKSIFHLLVKFHTFFLHTPSLCASYNLQRLERVAVTQGPVGQIYKGEVMNILDQIEVPKMGPQIITICGDAGTGKSSLAATFPKPIFIRAEDGVARIPQNIRPNALPLVQTEDELWDQLKALLGDEHDFQTLVIDSVSALDRVFVQSILKRDGKAQSLNQALGGYGAGFSALSTMHQRVRKAAEYLRERRGMNAVFIAHAEVDSVRPPDQEDYSRYSLRMTHSKSLPPYIDDVDAVGFLRQRMFVKGDEGERKRVISTEDRELVMHLTAANVSKNAYGITEPLAVKLGENPLGPFLADTKSKPAPEKTTETTKEENKDTDT